MNIKSFIALVILYGLINLVLWGGQELYYRNDTKEINRIESMLAQGKSDIDSLQLTIQNQEARLEQEDRRLNILESSNQVELYNAGVFSYNDLLGDYKTNLDIYNGKIDSYNSQVETLNQLIEKSGSRWYLIPIPLPGKSTHSKL